MKSKDKNTCPFCGNEHEEEFNIMREKRMYNFRKPGEENEVTIFNVCCSCGVKGPDAHNIEDALKTWNERKTI